MPRFPAVAKTIHGQEVSQQVFLNTICETILHVDGGARVGDLIPTLGPEHDTTAGRRLIGQTLHNLFTRGLLSRGTEKGVYTVNANHYKRAGVTRFDQDEKAILRILRRRGGFARYSEIMEDLDLRPKGSAEDRAMVMAMPEYRRITDVLAKSQLIRQDIVTRGEGNGVYNLPWPEISALPLMGRWANKYIKYTYGEIIHVGNRGLPEEERRTVGPHDWQLERDAFFEHVGAAFRRLRRLRKLEINDLLDNKKVRSAIFDFWRSADKTNGPIPVLRQEWQDHRDIEIEKIRKAAEEDDGRPLTVRRQEAQAKVTAYKAEQDQVWELERYRWLYRHFENGRVGAHCFAPLSFYTGIAEFYEVCPAALSRGAILLMPTPEKIRPEGYERRTLLEKIDAELQNEADLAATRRLLDEIEAERQERQNNGAV